MPLAVELELNPVVDGTLALHSLTDACLDEQVGDTLFEHARADACLDVVAAAVLEHDRVDPLQVEEVREHEARRAGPDDADLRAHQPSSRTRWAIANAEFGYAAAVGVVLFVGIFAITIIQRLLFGRPEVA